jgi:hypothetical protein
VVRRTTDGVTSNGPEEYLPGVLPSDDQLLAMVEDQLTFEQILDECERLTGRRVFPSTLTAALSRAALPTTTGHRYLETVPWRVLPEHASHPAVRMLRTLGRRCNGFPTWIQTLARLDRWLVELALEGLVVAYCPDDPDGFVYVEESLRSGPNPDLPLRARPLSLDEVAQWEVRRSLAGDLDADREALRGAAQLRSWQAE